MTALMPKEHHKDEKNGTIVKIFKRCNWGKVEDGVFVITDTAFW